MHPRVHGYSWVRECAGALGTGHKASLAPRGAWPRFCGCIDVPAGASFPGRVPRVHCWGVHSGRFCFASSSRLDAPDPARSAAPSLVPALRPPTGTESARSGLPIAARCRMRLPGTRAPGGVVQQRPDGSQHHGLLGCARRAQEHPHGRDRAQAQHFAALAPVPARGHHPGRRCPESDRLPWGPCGGKIPHPSSQPPPAPVTTRLPLPRILFCHHQEGRPPHGGGEGPREIGGGLQQTLTSPVRRGASRGVMSVTVVTVSPGPATRALLGGVGYEGTRLPRRGGSRQTLTTVTNPHPPRRPLPGTRCRRRADPSGLAASGARYHAPGAGLP